MVTRTQFRFLDHREGVVANQFSYFLRGSDDFSRATPPSFYWLFKGKWGGYLGLAFKICVDHFLNYLKSSRWLHACLVFEGLMNGSENFRSSDSDWCLDTFFWGVDLLCFFLNLTFECGKVARLLLIDIPKFFLTNFEWLAFISTLKLW